MKVRDLIGTKVITPSSAGEQYTPQHVEELRVARQRVRKMSVHDLLAWADSAGTGMAKALGDYRRENDSISLEEIRTGLVALSAVIDELTVRHETRGT